MTQRLGAMFVLLALCAPASSCGNGGRSEPEPQWLGELFFAPSVLGLLEGDARVVKLKIQSTPNEDLTVALAVNGGGEAVAGFPAEVVFEPGEYVKDVEIQGLSLGTVTITASYTGNPLVTYEADLAVYVGESGYSCDESASGTIGPGERLETSAGGAFVAFGDDDRFSDVDATIDCADDIVPDGYVALGPAVTFGPVHARYMREAEFGIPVNGAMMPAAASIGDLVVYYEGSGVDARIVPVGNGWITGDPTDGLYTFLSPRFGTYQAAVEEGAGTRSFQRRYTYRGITGVSMGGGGAALVGLRNHARFDFISPLGGPANWTAMLHYVETYHLGGFCTALDDDAGDVGEHCDPPATLEMFEFGQEFENWFYQDGWDGQGGTFNREDYCQIFRDIARAFGNLMFYNLDSSYLPPGVTWEWMQGSRAEKCADGGHMTLDNFYDRLFNPDGSMPVITFCDGAEWRDTDGTRDVGRWDPDGDQYYPLDITLAVDVNDNGRRDAHEPVIAQGYEPYEDVGVDGLASTAEEGYDAVTNPDPSGDDYDYQFNPAGTERNHIYDEGEPYLDYGLDGVDGTPQQPSGYDYGEGNGQFDYNPNIDNLWEHDALQVIRAMTDDELRRIDIVTDAGLRDLFDFAPGENGILGELLARGQPVGLYRNFASLYGSDDEDHFDSTRVDYPGLQKNYIIIYGDEDADEDLLQRGDGGHVGTASQVLNRLATVTMFMSARWPGGDR
ncbi:MAG: hypothetical protein JRG91_03475, partial [Deltaproteobacteria bacterium]|nr:hypothetical protein [Deltaproteobacteria bacterium]